jgi:hypothetical protein
MKFIPMPRRNKNNPLIKEYCMAIQKGKKYLARKIIKKSHSQEEK